MAINETISIAQLAGLGAANPLAAVLPASVGGATIAMTVPQLRGFHSLPPPDADPAVNVANITAAFAAAGGGLLIAPVGVYEIDDTIDIRNVQGLRYLGSAATVFVWVGDDAARPLFRLAHCNRCVFDGLYMRAEGAALGHVHLLRDNLNGATLTPSGNRILNSVLEGQGNTVYGVLIGGPGAVDANNEFNTFEQVTVSGYQEAGFYAPNSQAYGTAMTDCVTDGGGAGKYGVDTGGVGASIRWTGGSFNQHTEADLRLGRSAQAHIIDGAQSEHSARFLDLTLDARKQIVVRGVRWIASLLHADGKCILAANTVQLTLDSCTIGGIQTPTLPLTMEFLTPTNPAPGSVRVINTTVISSADQVFIGDTQGVTVEGSSQTTSIAPPLYRTLTVEGV